MPLIPLQPLDYHYLRTQLVDNDTLGWRGLQVVTETGSTNTDMVELAAQDLVLDRQLLLAEYQHQGRGRYTRSFEAPPFSSVTFSALIRTRTVSPLRWPLLSLALGIAVVDGLRRTVQDIPQLLPTDYPNLSLKWPNDVLCNGGKLAGMLVEMSAVDKTYDGGETAAAIIAGVGINITQSSAELPVDYAMSLAMVLGDKTPRREDIAVNVLHALDRRVSEWRSGSETIIRDYVERCSTIGQEIDVQLPSGEIVSGRALDIADDGCLLLQRTSRKIDAIRAGDVRHLRGGGCYLP